MNLNEIKLPAKIFLGELRSSDRSTFITVDHLDGMYSYGVSENGNPTHLSRFTPLKKVKGGYEIVPAK